MYRNVFAHEYLTLPYRYLGSTYSSITSEIRARFCAQMQYRTKKRKKKKIQSKQNIFCRLTNKKHTPSITNYWPFWLS